jgi:hypothetical protein
MTEGGRDGGTPIKRSTFLAGLLGGATALITGHAIAPSGQAKEAERPAEQVTASFARDEDVVGELDSEKYIVTNVAKDTYGEAPPASGETGFRVTSSGTGWSGPAQQEGIQFYTQGKDVSRENLFVKPVMINGKDGRRAIKVIVDSAVQFNPLDVAPEKTSFWLKDTSGNVVETKTLQREQSKEWQKRNGIFFIPIDGSPGFTADNVTSPIQLNDIGSFGVDMGDSSGSKTIQFTATREVVQ